MYKIDKKKHPIPQPTRTITKYPWHAMKVGESFLVPDGNYHKIYAATAMTNRRKAPRRWVAKVVTAGVRVWRVA